MVRLRWVKQGWQEYFDGVAYGDVQYHKEKVLEYSYMENITEIGIKEPIWSDWLEVPTENIDT